MITKWPIWNKTKDWYIWGTNRKWEVILIEQPKQKVF
mgnify:CR=1 FL=1